MMHTLRERNRKVERKKGQRYGNEFQRNAVGQKKACDDKSAIWCKRQAATGVNL
jgi:hypothetical protein